MPETITIEQLKQQVARLERKINGLIEEKRKQTWVKVGMVTALTGWNKRTLAQMRTAGIVKWKKDNGIWYLLESVPREFYKQAS